MHTLWYWLGLTNSTGSWYLWWSGVAASVPDIAALAVLWAWWDHRKCYLCRRIGWHPILGTAWATCHQHLSRTIHDELRTQYVAMWPEQAEMLRDPAQPEPPPG